MLQVPVVLMLPNTRVDSTSLVMRVPPATRNWSDCTVLTPNAASMLSQSLSR